MCSGAGTGRAPPSRGLWEAAAGPLRTPLCPTASSRPCSEGLGRILPPHTSLVPLPPSLANIPGFGGSQIKAAVPRRVSRAGSAPDGGRAGGHSGDGHTQSAVPKAAAPGQPLDAPVSASGLTGADVCVCAGQGVGPCPAFHRWPGGPSDPPCLPVTVWTALLGTTRDEPHRMGSETRSVSRP